MKLGIEFVPYVNVQRIVEWAKLAEDVGFDYIWVTDHYNNRNVYVSLTAIALSTDRAMLGPGVTNPYVINPAWTASAVATLNELSNGRAVLGIGPGDRITLTSLNVPMERPLAAVRESVETIRRLWRSEAVDLTGDVFSFKGAKLNFKVGRIPIYVGAQGPRMLELAGKIGDGVLVNASHPDDLRVAVGHISKGTSSIGRNVADVDVAAYTCFSIDVDGRKAKEKASEVVAFIIAGCPIEVLKRHKISEDEANEVKEAVAKGDFTRAFSLVTDDMISSFSISGTPEECLSKLMDLTKAGVTQIVIGSPIGPRKVDAIKLIAQKLIPTLKAQ